MGNKSSLSPGVRDRGTRVLDRESGKKCIPTFVTRLTKIMECIKIYSPDEKVINKINKKVGTTSN